MRPGHATNAEVRAIIGSGVTFDDVFETTTAEATPDSADQGYRMISTGTGQERITSLVVEPMISRRTREWP